MWEPIGVMVGVTIEVNVIKKSIDNSTHFFWSDEEVDRVIVGVFGRVMVKSSYQFYRMILLTRHFPKNNSREFKNPGRDRKLESMEYFSFETQKDGNVISESGVLIQFYLI